MKKTKAFAQSCVFLIGAVLFASNVYAQTNIARTGRFYRGSGTNTSLQSFVIPLNFQKGVAFDDLGNSFTNFFSISWSTNYHYNATNTSQYITNKTPIVAFGSRVGGSPLYFDQDYQFGIFAGTTYSSFFTNSILIGVYKQSDFSFVSYFYVPLPRIADTNAWRSFVTNGYTTTVTNFGLITTVRFDDPYEMWGVLYPGTYHIIHRAQSLPTNYIYSVSVLGYSGTGAWMSLTSPTDPSSATWSRLYTLEFQQRSPWRAFFLDQPQFAGTPVPSFYQGKTVEELLTNAPPVTNTVTLSPSACTNLDASPELRRHSILDQFVTDMRSDPLALANYVQNEIELTDGIGYNENGPVTDVSINPGGVSRSALATFMEKQGSPTEQCALLVYLLRQAGVPAVYVFPPENGLKMVDTQVSKLLRMQIHGAINNAVGANDQPYTTNTLIAVNYPWVAAYIGTNWVHLFPWLKDTEVVEGLNLYNYTPANYKTSYQWIKDYLYGNTNIMNLSADDDTPQKLFPLFVRQMLATNSPGISLDDIGVQIVNRRHLYSRWGDFPRPTVVTNVSTTIESLGSSAITNVYARLTNIFDTVSVQVSSVANPTTKLITGNLLMVDLHNRKFLIRHEKITSTSHRIIMTLEPYRTGTNGVGAFTNDTALLKQQSVTNTLGSGDDDLTVQIVYNRHRFLPVGFTTPNFNLPYLGLEDVTSVTNSRPMRKGDLSAICFNVGRVTPKMLQVHAQELWNMESTLKANPSATNTLSPDVYQGTTAYLMGMAYYEKISRFDEVNQHLHKVQVQSQFGMGLASIRAARTNNALPSGNIDLVQPSVDMFFKETVIAGNSTLHLNSGDDGNVPQDDYFHLYAANASAQEHSVINHFFQQTDAVSTVKLLQMAQSKSATNGPGILLLDCNNYIAEGEKNYPTNGSVKLKNQNTNIWATITNAFFNNFSTDANFVQVFITAGPVTNQTKSFKGMGAFIIQPTGAAALIAEKNGGYGANNPPGSLDVANSSGMSLTVDSEDNYSIDLTPTSSANHTLAPDEYAAHNDDNVSDNATANLYDYTATQTAWANMTADYLGLPLSSQNLNYALAVQAAGGNLAAIGWTSDALGQYGSGVIDPVHVVTGEFYIDTTDLALPGPMPLMINRNYSSLNLADNQFGYGWKLNYMPFLSMNTSNTVIFAAEPNGAVLAYRKTTTNANVYLPAPTYNPQLNNASEAGIGSMANRLLNRIEKQVVGPDTFYFLYNPDGSKRTFKVMTFAGGTISRTRPYLTTWQDSTGNSFSFEYGTNSTDADFAEVRRVQSSNGSFCGFYYDVFGHITEAYTGDGRRLFYEYDQFGDLITVTLPDQAEIQYQYQHFTQSVTNGSTVTVSPYSTHLIVQEIKPDGRTLKNEYDQFRRVTNQWSTVGADLSLVRNATFIFSNNFNLTNSFTNTISGFTLVKDVFNSTNRYDYTNGLITKITNPLNQTIVQDWYEDSETNKTGYYPRSLESRTDSRGLLTQFKYDGNGNATNTVISGDITGSGTAQTATNVVFYNTNNLPTSTIDSVNNRAYVIYDSTYPFLPGLVIRFAGNTAVSTNKLIYTNATTIFVSGGVTYTNAAFGLMQQKIRAYGSPDAATNAWTYDGRGFITQCVNYTGTSDPAITNTYLYNDRGELVEKTDAGGRKNAYGYDPLGRPTAHEVFEANATQPMFWEYSYYNDNGELVWSDGPRFNPEDYVWRDYDGAGRKITEIHWRSEAKSDGSGVQAPADANLYAQTFFQYDYFGNLTRIVDPRGAITTNSFDAVGKLVQSRHFDLDGTTVLSTEGFAYEPGGLLRYQTNALGGVLENQYTSTGLPKFRRNFDGSTNAWLYYVDGRIRREIQGNGAYSETTYDDANRKTIRIFYSVAGSPLATNISTLDRRGNQIQTVDAGGNTFTKFFDGFDRLKTASGPAISSVSENCGSTPGCGIYVTNVLQQSLTNFYDPVAASVTSVNALGEKTIIFFDSLGRTTRTEIRNAANALVRESSTAFAQDQNSITITNGSGASAILGTTYTDNDGRNLLSITYPNANLREFSLNQYDLAGNAIFSERASLTNGTVTQWTTTSNTFDGLNRLKTQAALDNAVTAFAYDAAGNLTNRLMPGSLNWSSTYNNAGQILTEKDSSGASTTRNLTYTYYSAGNAFAGLLNTVTDGRGVARTSTYDDYLRAASVTTTGSLPEQQMTRSWQYEVRGYVKTVTQSYADTNTGPAITITDTYDAYGQLTSGNGMSQSWDASGRRTVSGAMGFQYRADGLMTAVNGASFGYGSNGLLTGRTNGLRTTTMDQRDGSGRRLQSTTRVNSSVVLTENWTWTGDGLPNNYTATRSDFTDTRRFTYGSLHRRLTQETLNLGSVQSVTNNYTFDNGAAAGLGVLTKTIQTGVSNSWSAGLDSFSRVIAETNSVIHRTASGTVNGPATLRAFLNGQNVDTRFDARTAGTWTVDMALTANTTNTLTVYADHPSGQFTTNKASTYTVGAGVFDKEDSQYDGAGNVTNRVWKRADGQVVRTQSLVWNAFGNLVKVSERDTNNSGFNLVALFDGMGRQVQTIETTVSNNVALAANPAPVIVTYTYDPQVEFLIVGIVISQGGFSRQDSLAYGPDVSGGYGGMQGVGGLEAVTSVTTAFNTTTVVINDAFGNIIGAVTNGVVAWNSSRLNLYAPVEGYAPPRLSLSVPTYTSLAWRTRPICAGNMVQLGARPYDFARRAFLAGDPLGHSSDAALNTAFAGNPAGYFDASGRLNQLMNQKFEMANNPPSFVDTLFGLADSALDRTANAIGDVGSYMYNGGPFGYGLRALGGYLNGYDNSSGGGGYISGAAGTLLNELAGMITPASYVNGAQSFSHNVSSYYQSDGIFAASSYALTSWNVGAVYSGAANFDLQYDTAGQSVGDGYQRWSVISGGVAGTTGIAGGGLSLFNRFTTPAATASALKIGVALGEDMSSADGITVWRNVYDGHGALADAQAGIVKPFGATSDASLLDRAASHDAGFTPGSGLTSWTADLRWALDRQASMGGVVLETKAPVGSIWFNAAKQGAESQILVPGKVTGTLVK